MLQDIEPHSFTPAWPETLRDASTSDRIVILSGQRILVHVGEKNAFALPHLSDFTDEQRSRILDSTHLQFLYTIDDAYVWGITRDLTEVFPNCAIAGVDGDVSELCVGPNFALKALWELRRTSMETAELFVASLAKSVLSWYFSNHFCTTCGHPLTPAPKSRELVCTHCSKIYYPKISPGVIVGVISENSLVLTRYANRPHVNYALVAGYVEVGERAEDCVRREVYEEINCHVDHIRYVDSQPWPFSDSLLLGYFAELKAGDVPTPDGVELAHARLYPQDELPPEASAQQISLTSYMIELFRTYGRDVLTMPQSALHL